MKKVLVTGACGFIGSNFVEHLLAHTDAEVVALDLLTYAGLPENLAGLPLENVLFSKGDICDRNHVESIFSDGAIDTVVHFAAESHVDRSIHDPGAFIRTNIMGTWTLLDVAKDKWKGRKDVRFHHVSTDEVYGSLRQYDPAFTEKTPYDPSSPYSASKAASDHLVRAYGRTFGLPITISNCSNNYGPRQFPEKLIPLMIMNADEGKPLPVYGDGKQRRDWLYVDDHCSAIAAILGRGVPGETYNVGGGCERENIDIVKGVCRTLDRIRPLLGKKTREDSLITYVADRPGHDRRYAVDYTKIEGELGWKPKWSFEAGLEKTIRWYLENPAWTMKAKESMKNWMKTNYEGRK